MNLAEYAAKIAATDAAFVAATKNYMEAVGEFTTAKERLEKAQQVMLAAQQASWEVVTGDDLRKGLGLAPVPNLIDMMCHEGVKA